MIEIVYNKQRVDSKHYQTFRQFKKNVQQQLQLESNLWHVEYNDNDGDRIVVESQDDYESMSETIKSIGQSEKKFVCFIIDEAQVDQITDTETSNVQSNILATTNHNIQSDDQQSQQDDLQDQQQGQEYQTNKQKQRRQIKKMYDLSQETAKFNSFTEDQKMYNISQETAKFNSYRQQKQIQKMQEQQQEQEQNNVANQSSLSQNFDIKGQKIIVMKQQTAHIINEQSQKEDSKKSQQYQKQQKMIKITQQVFKYPQYEEQQQQQNEDQEQSNDGRIMLPPSTLNPAQPLQRTLQFPQENQSRNLSNRNPQNIVHIENSLNSSQIVNSMNRLLLDVSSATRHNNSQLSVHFAGFLASFSQQLSRISQELQNNRNQIRQLQNLSQSFRRQQVSRSSFHYKNDCKSVSTQTSQDTGLLCKLCDKSQHQYQLHCGQFLICDQCDKKWQIKHKAIRIANRSMLN